MRENRMEEGARLQPTTPETDECTALLEEVRPKVVIGNNSRKLDETGVRHEAASDRVNAFI